MTKEEAKKMIEGLSRAEKEELYRMVRHLEEMRKGKVDKRKEKKK